MVPTTLKRKMWRVTEAPWRMLQRSLCCSFAAFSWFWGLVSSQYLISTRWMSRWVLLRSLGRRLGLTNWEFTPKRNPWQLTPKSLRWFQLQAWKFFASPFLWWHTAPLHRHLQISPYGVRQADQSDYCGWRSFATIHGWKWLSKSSNSSRAMTLLAKEVHNHIWLLKTYAIPASMYASQI